MSFSVEFAMQPTNQHKSMVSRIVPEAARPDLEREYDSTTPFVMMRAWIATTNEEDSILLLSQ